MNATAHGGITSPQDITQRGRTEVLLKLLSIKDINLHAVHYSSGFTALDFTAFILIGAVYNSNK
jgi:hypothetical protein